MKHYVYHICREGREDELDHGYIGVTVDPQRRWDQHQRCAYNQNLQQKVYHFMRKFKDTISFRIIFEGSFEEAYEFEAAQRPEQGMGWNMARGGDNTHNMFGIKCIIDGVEYESINHARRETGLDYQTIKKIQNGEEVFITRLRDRAIPPSNLKPVTLECAKTGEEHSFRCLSEAWEWMGKQGSVSGNIKKQSAKGRPAYGYYWKY